MTGTPGQSRPFQRVLVVDDNAAWLRAVGSALREQGYEVRLEAESIPAIDALRRELPDLLITDFLLARIDGVKLCRVAKHHLGVNNITTVILTSAADRRLQLPNSLDVDAVIAKNSLEVSLADLRRVISELEQPEGRQRLSDQVIGLERLAPRNVTSKLHSLKRYLDTLYECVGDAVFEIDFDGRLYRLNDNGRKLLGLAEEQAVARRIDEMLGLEADHPLLQAIARHRDKSDLANEPIVVEIGRRTLRFRTASLTSIDGYSSILLVASDITDLITAEREHIALVSRLHMADKMAALGQLTAGIAHEINNPLAGLLPNLDTLDEMVGLLCDYLTAVRTTAKAEDKDRDIDGRYLDQVDDTLVELPRVIGDCLEASRRIRDTTQQMKQFSHLQDTTGELTTVEEVMDSTLSLAANELRFRARMIKSYAGTLPLVVNRTKLGQAFLNILLNAVQAFKDDAIEKNWIRVTTGAEAGGIVVEIANNGEPIPESERARIFDPFFTTKPIGSGTGLGLAICYDVVQKHRGEIDVRGGEDGETIFRIWLPRETGLSIDPVVPDRTQQEHRPARIMLVDDELLVLRGLRRILHRSYHVVLATGGEEALQILQAGDRFELIICDLMMPDTSGMEVYEQAKRLDVDQANRFVFLTGGAFTEGARSFLAGVDNPRAEKPLDTGEVLKLVAGWLEAAPFDSEPKADG